MNRKLIKPSGFYSNVSDIGQPEGSLSDCKNMLVRTSGLLQMLPGWETDEDERVDDEDFYNRPVYGLTQYNGSLIAATGTLNISSEPPSALDLRKQGSPYTSLSTTINVPANARMPSFAEGKGILYFANGTGPYLYDGTNTPSKARGLEAPGFTATVAGTGMPHLTAALNWLGDDEQTCYRILIGFRNTKNRLIYGRPSGRRVVINETGASSYPRLTISLPTDVTTSSVIQVYRATKTAYGSGQPEPDDQMRLVYETNPTAAEVTAKSMTIDDTVIDGLQQAELYTNSSQEGIALQNSPPPIACRLAFFKSCMFYANTKEAYRLDLRILSVGAPYGLQNGDTITIDGVTYTGNTSTETASTGTFKIYTGYGTLSENVRATAESLCYVVNAYASNTTVWARYVADGLDEFGKMVLEARNHVDAGTGFTVTHSSNTTTRNINTGGLSRAGTTVTGTTTANHGFAVGDRVYVSGADSNFPSGIKVVLTQNGTTGFTYSEPGTATTSASAYTAKIYHGEAFIPILPPSGSDVIARRDEKKNRIFISKPGEPEAVPEISKLDIGNELYKIVSIVPMKNSLLVFKEDGLYRVKGFGEVGGWSVELVDSTLVFLAEEGVSSVRGDVYAISTRGFVRVSEYGYGLISDPVQDMFDSFQPIINSEENVGYQYYMRVAGNESTGDVFFLTSIGNSSVAQGGYVCNIDSGKWAMVDWQGTGSSLNKGVTAMYYSKEDSRLYAGYSLDNFVAWMASSGPIGVAAPSNSDSIIDRAFKVLVTVNSVASSTYTVSTTYAGGTAYVEAGDYFNGQLVTSKTSSTIVVSGTASGTGVKVLSKLATRTYQFGKYHAGDPTEPKHFSEVLIVTTGLGSGSWANTSTVSSMSVTMDNDLGASSTFTATPVDSSYRLFRMTVPQEVARCSWLRVKFVHTTYNSRMQVVGISYVLSQDAGTRAQR